MPVYRFVFQAEDERSRGEERRWLPNDDAAVGLAEALLENHPIIMLWREDHFIRRVTKRDE